MRNKTEIDGPLRSVSTGVSMLEDAGRQRKDVARARFSKAVDDTRPQVPPFALPDLDGANHEGSFKGVDKLRAAFKDSTEYINDSD